jgi:hypothetical protein
MQQQRRQQETSFESLLLIDVVIDQITQYLDYEDKIQFSFTCKSILRVTSQTRQLLFIKMMFQCIDEYVRSFEDNHTNDPSLLLMTIHKCHLLLIGKYTSLKYQYKLQSNNSRNEVDYDIFDIYFGRDLNSHDLSQLKSEKQLQLSYNKSLILKGYANILTVCDDRVAMCPTWGYRDKTVTFELYPVEFSDMYRTKYSRVLVTLIFQVVDIWSMIVGTVHTNDEFIAEKLGIGSNERMKLFQVHFRHDYTQFRVYPVLDTLNELMGFAPEKYSWRLIQFLIHYAQMPIDITDEPMIMNVNYGFTSSVGLPATDVRTESFEQVFSRFISLYSDDSVWKCDKLIKKAGDQLNELYCTHISPFSLEFINDRYHPILRYIAALVKNKRGYMVFNGGKVYLKSSFRLDLQQMDLKIYVKLKQDTLRWEQQIEIEPMNSRTASLMGLSIHKSYHLSEKSKRIGKLKHLLKIDYLPDRILLAVFSWIGVSVENRCTSGCQYSLKYQSLDCLQPLMQVVWKGVEVE